MADRDPQLIVPDQEEVKEDSLVLFRRKIRAEEEKKQQIEVN